jgi:hypothetical protein
MVVNRRRSGFSSGVVAAITTTISTFLCTSMPAILYGWERSACGETKLRRTATIPFALAAGAGKHVC